MNNMTIHNHVIFRPRNAMFFLLNTYVFRIGNDDVIVILYG